MRVPSEDRAEAGEHPPWKDATVAANAPWHTSTAVGEDLPESLAPELRVERQCNSAAVEPTADPQDASVSRRRQGRAHPYTGENHEIRLEDCLPPLQRASAWNEWSKEELLLQLAGHLRGRALQEWNLLAEGDNNTWDCAVHTLHCRLDSGSRAMAAQDFRHTLEKETETVADFTRRLERMFRIAYGGDTMALETQEAILYDQVQEGLRYQLVEAAAMCGAESSKQPRTKRRDRSNSRNGSSTKRKELPQGHSRNAADQVCMTAGHSGY